MANFLVLYRADTATVDQMSQATPEQAKAGMDAWMQWFGAAGDAIVDGGAPTQGPDATITGYSILKADDRAAAEALVADHPHRQMGTIEVYECLAMPGM